MVFFMSAALFVLLARPATKSGTFVIAAAVGEVALGEVALREVA